jgi:hypothetical protein
MRHRKCRDPVKRLMMQYYPEITYNLETEKMKSNNCQRILPDHKKNLPDSGYSADPVGQFIQKLPPRKRHHQKKERVPITVCTQRDRAPSAADQKDPACREQNQDMRRSTSFFVDRLYFFAVYPLWIRM